MRKPHRTTSVRTLAVAGAAALLGTTLPMAALTAAPADGASIGQLDRRISDGTVKESSGLARSTYDRTILWTHNDSGGKARVYAVDKSGRTKAVVTLKGASSRDWEDISAGTGHSMWVGDIGDNSKRRGSIQVYRFTEPQGLSNRTVSATKFELKYPDGRHNAEGLMVHPKTGRVYVATKAQSGGAIYRAPATLSSSRVNKLTKVTSGTPVKITAAAFTPDGSRFVLCNYSRAFVYNGFSAKPKQLKKPSLQQGESLDVARNGKSLLMGSEGRNSPVFSMTLPSR